MADTRVRIKHRTANKAEWESTLSAEVLLNGEIAFVRDEDANANYFKVGNGTSKFYTLPYVTAPKCYDEVVVGTKAEWQALSDFIPSKGQIVVWTDAFSNHLGKTVPGIKIGDGSSYNIDLPFAGDNIMETALSALSELAAHILSDSHLKDDERQSWKHKITVGRVGDDNDDGVEGERLIISRN